METPPDDLDRLFQETLTELGFNIDAKAIAQNVKRLDYGLPAEDEFSVICAWLGKLVLLHKLDQHQIPTKSKQIYQVPDLLARFETQNNASPVLIEVKKKNTNTLSFKPEYLERLQNYSELAGMRLLIAWKFHSVWSLFDVCHLKRAVKNFNITYSDAMSENLLGVLAGDVAYKIGSGAGIHLRMKKEELIAVEDTKSEKLEQWQMRIDRVEFTDRDGKVTTSLSTEVQSLVITGDMERVEEHHDDHIWVRYIATEEGIQFAHMVLVRLLDWSQLRGQEISWRREARKEKLNTIEDIRSALNLALEEKVVRNIFYLHPLTVPDFVKDQNSITAYK